MKIAIVGFGSIGARHAEILNRVFGHEVRIVSSRPNSDYARYPAISQMLQDYQPEYVIISNPTYEHYSSLQMLAELNYDGHVLVEKPIFSDIPNSFDFSFQSIRVLYNLRFHPILQELKSVLADEQMISAQVYAGQYLPTWRPRVSIEDNYSSHKSKGGGVIRDLSHELDYSTWLFGKWNHVSAIGGKYSSMKITSDDSFSLLMVTDKCPAVSIQINYLDRISQRKVIINTDKTTILADLVHGTIQMNQVQKSFQTERNFTYVKQYEAIFNDSKDVCSLTEGLEVMRLINAAERSAEQKVWVPND
ncbi:Gfo/Idh/MocA family protein [Paenibacillus alginolyticus]|uniref:Gfo/Idh/MocA family oxidoreductase n=1 Tax=Paenibacillus alginolyticus TaxID=59839 RepID=A0ABT4G8P3_9BACL|nr:Gfo/Idh/MocA family oxidoreductase [Paenibacillus alginolyticus]MCY9692556.1 Gfo/Idh/MocA family oxidoreductase [Paenibacillus alginolyticus]MEC0143762.1 Gfo/Idh/MocA family oxidoreductase [Paenibacillus alginolyticus]